MTKIESKEEWGWYTKRLDVDAKYSHRHNGEPERFPCLVSSHYWDDPNGPYTYDHSFTYQKKSKCATCGHEVLEWDVEDAATSKPVQGQEKTKKCACGNGVYPGCGDKCQECVI